MSAKWFSLLGLAGGIDKDGSRGAELLAAGFGSVEFGTVTPLPEPGANPGVAALVARLSALDPLRLGSTRIGIGIGMGNRVTAAALHADWLSGFNDAWGTADYLSFNLSARRYRPLVAAEHLPLLVRTFDGIVAERHRRTTSGDRRPALTLKLALGEVDAFPLALAEAAIDAGFDAVTAVLPECTGRLDRLHALACRLAGRGAVIAVGGILTAADLRAAVDAGADAVQVHTAFVRYGAACVPALLAP